MEQNMESEGSRSGVATYIVEAVVAGIILIIGLVMVWESVKLGHRWEAGGPGSGYFPFYIGVILTVGSLVTFIQAFMAKHKNDEIFVDSVQLGRVMQVLIPALFFVAAINFLGIYISAAIYIALFMIILGKNSVFKSVGIAVALNVLFFCAFEIWFKVPLYKGSLDLLGFLGY